MFQPTKLTTSIVDRYQQEMNVERGSTLTPQAVGNPQRTVEELSQRVWEELSELMKNYQAA